MSATWWAHVVSPRSCHASGACSTANFSACQSSPHAGYATSRRGTAISCGSCLPCGQVLSRPQRRVGQGHCLDNFGRLAWSPASGDQPQRSGRGCTYHKAALHAALHLRHVTVVTMQCTVRRSTNVASAHSCTRLSCHVISRMSERAVWDDMREMLSTLPASVTLSLDEKSVRHVPPAEPWVYPPLIPEVLTSCLDVLVLPARPLRTDKPTGTCARRTQTTKRGLTRHGGRACTRNPEI